jgi:hypothetical protein
LRNGIDPTRSAGVSVTCRHPAIRPAAPVCARHSRHDGLTRQHHAIASCVALAFSAATFCSPQPDARCARGSPVKRGSAQVSLARAWSRSAIRATARRKR